MGRPRPFSNRPSVFDKESQPHRRYIGNIKQHLKKMLVYYPKNIQALKLITTQMFNQRTYVSTDAVYLRVLSKYKRDLLKHFETSVFYNRLPLMKKGGKVQTLSIQTDYPYYFTSCRLLPPIPVQKVLRMNKNLQVLKLDANFVSSVIFRQIKYFPCLSSIELDGVPNAREYNRSFLASKFSLKSATFISPNTVSKIDKQGKNDIQFLRMILELPCLQKINFSSESPDRITINDIPFNILRKRNSSFVIHIAQTSELSPSTPNQLGLVNLEFLGLHFNESWTVSGPEWDICYEDYLNILQGYKRKLFLDLNYEKLVGLSNLIITCKNITTLQIVVSDCYIKRKIDFSSLKHLANLRHLFIEFWESKASDLSQDTKTMTNDYLGLFKSLTLCAKTLKSASLYIRGEKIKEKEDEIFGFFEACANSLSQITLKFTFGSKLDPQNIESFYRGLRSLNRVESIKLVGTRFKSHSKYLKHVLSNKSCLKEFYFCAPFTEAKELFIDFGKLKDVSKLSLNMIISQADYEPFHKPSYFSNLRYFELALGLPNLLIWHVIVKMLNRIKTLEVLLLLWNEKESEDKILMLWFEKLFKSHSNLKFISFGNKNNVWDVRIFLRKCSFPLPSLQDVDNFYGREMGGLPDRKNQRICLLLDA